MKNILKLFTVISLLFINMVVFSQSKNMNLLGTWSDNTIPTNASGFRYNEVWGFVHKGKEYAVIASKIGTHIIDVTNDTNIHEVDRVLGKFRGNVVHRDYHSHNGYLYMVCDEGASSLQIADLSYLPDSVHVIYDSDALIIRSHNIFIDTNSNILYTAGGSNLTGGNQLSLIDISTPSNPFLLTNLGLNIPWWNSAIGYCHDIYVQNDTVYTNDGNAMHIVDLTNYSSPILLGTLSTYPDKGYNHAGYLAADNETYVMCDETHTKRVKFIDVSSPSSITVTDLEGVVGGDPSAIPHNPIVFNKFAYVSYYYDGIYIYDISDKYDVKTSAFYDTYSGPNGYGYKGCWGVYPFLPSGKILVSDIYSGLLIFEHVKPPVIQFDTNRVLVLESGVSTTVTVSLSHVYDDSVEVDVVIDTASTGIKNVDWSSSTVFPLHLKFPATSTASHSFTITTIDDTIFESTETVIFKLENVINGELNHFSSDTIFILDNEFVGLEEVKKDELLIYPNPVKKGNSITFSKHLDFELMDVNGKVIQKKSNSNMLSTDKLSKGIYFISTDNKKVKFIVN